MIHHVKSAFRYLNRNRVATTINVVGLAVALSAAFLMLQYLDFELSYDTYLPEHENVYRIVTEQKESGVINRHTAEAYYAIADWITANFPEVNAATRFNRWPANTGFTLEVDGKLYNEKRYLIADKGFFKVFPSLLIAGNRETCLDGPNHIIVSERLALKVFGTTDIIGKAVTNPNWKGHVFMITGVFQHTPANSHLDADIFHSFEWIPDADQEWITTVWTYIRVTDGIDIPKLEERLNAAIAPMLPDQKITAKVTLQPLSQLHFSNLNDEVKAPGSMLYIYMVSAALVLILVLAWINYVNLETARFIKRLKDVGIRRIIGSSRKDLFARFFTEHLFVTVTAIILAMAVVYLVFPWFGYITGLPLSTFSFSVPKLWIGTTLLFMLAAVVAGVYPFISVIRINPVKSLKGHVAAGGSLVRRSLLTFQFVASLTLMALVVMAFFQLDFMRSANMNFDKENVITIYNSANYTYLEDSLRKGKNEVFRNRLMQIPSVSALATSSAIPGEPIGFTYTDLAKRSMSDPDRQVHYKVMYIDYDFIPLFGLELMAGRNYSRKYSDTNCLVITESTIRELGFKSADEALNQKIYFIEDEWEQWTIIGIVKDYRHESVKTPVNPGIFRLHRNKGQMVYYSVKMEAGADASAVVPAVEQLWKETWPGKPFDFFFMDQHYDQQYKSEIHFSRVFTLFAGVAGFIACLGIMGMTLFEANARIKEIGIRKVLGAEVLNIIALLTKDSFRILVFSFMIALPLVYFLSSQWLLDYPEHISFSFWFLAAPFAVMIALVGVVSLTQVIKAALRNPVESLKQE